MDVGNHTKQSSQPEWRADGARRARFGDTLDFWARYDKLSDKYDSDMMGRLNGNLDILLIFVSASAAIRRT